MKTYAGMQSGEQDWGGRAFVTCLVAMGLGLFCEAGTTQARGADLYVDQVQGDDALDGRSDRPMSLVAGPVRTLRRGLERARRGDVLHLGPPGSLFFGSVELQGRRHSGVEGLPFTIDGNGCILSGARLVPPQGWYEVSPNLWRLKPRRKGQFLLLHEHTPLPEAFVAPGAKDVPPLEFGQWCAWQGNIYLQTDPEELETPAEVPFALATEEVGISLLDVQHVLIRNLTIRHFRLDGINAHDHCQTVIFDNVHAVENGRAGLSVSGNSLVGASNCRFERNRSVQLLNSETAQTELLDTTLGDEPRLRLQIRGGHVLFNGEELDRQNPQLPAENAPEP